MRTQLIRARKEAGLTQKQVATAAGIDRSFYTHIERGTRTPSLLTAIRIAEILNKDVGQLFGAQSRKGSQKDSRSDAKIF